MNLLNKAQKEHFQGITTFLRQTRQNKFIPLEKIAAETHIRQALLEALEEGQSKELPEAVFVQGFIRRYADTLGLDGTALAHLFGIHCFSLSGDNQGSNLDKIINIYIHPVVPYILLLAAASLGLFQIPNPPTTAENFTKNQNCCIYVWEQPILPK